MKLRDIALFRNNLKFNNEFSWIVLLVQIKVCCTSIYLNRYNIDALNTQSIYQTMK